MIPHTKNRTTWIAGILSATASSFCCLPPLLTVVGGAGGLASSISWIAPFRPYFIGLTILVFSLVWYQKLETKKRIDCNCESGKKTSFLQSISFLSIVTVLAALLITFPYYSTGFYAEAGKTEMPIANGANIIKAKFKIKGMTCDGCTKHVDSKIAELEGVIDYRTSYQQANSIVSFDNRKTCVNSIEKAINATGYKVTFQALINK